MTPTPVGGDQRRSLATEAGKASAARHGVSERETIEAPEEVKQWMEGTR